MKSLLAAAGAAVIGVAMLAQPASAAPHCVWQGTYWRCWNGHSWYRDYHGNRAELRHDWRWRHHDMHTGNSVETMPRHGMRYDHGDWNYGR